MLPKKWDLTYAGNPYGNRSCTGDKTGMDHCQKDFKYMVDLWNKVYVNAPNMKLKPYRMRCLPYAFFAGVTKSGTTDLFSNILNHPDVMAPAMKEPMYFNWNRLG